MAQETILDSLMVNYEETAYGEIGAFGVSKNGKYICVSGERRGVYVMDVLSQKILFPFTLGYKSPVTDIEFSPNDSLIAIGGSNNYIQLRDLYSGAPILTDRLSRYMTMPVVKSVEDMRRGMNWYRDTFNRYRQENRFLYTGKHSAGAIFRSNYTYEYFTPFEVIRFSLSDKAMQEIDSNFTSSRLQVVNEPPIKYYSKAPAPWVLKWIKGGEINKLCYSNDFNYCALVVKNNGKQYYLEIWDVVNRKLIRQKPLASSVDIIFMGNDGQVIGYTTDVGIEATTIHISNLSNGTSRAVFSFSISERIPGYYYDNDRKYLYVYFKTAKTIENEPALNFLFQSLRKNKVLPVDTGNKDSSSLIYAIDTIGNIKTITPEGKVSPDNMMANEKGVYIQSGQFVSNLNTATWQSNAIYTVTDRNAISYLDVKGDSLFTGSPASYRVFNIRTLKQDKFVQLAAAGKIKQNPLSAAVYFQDTLNNLVTVNRNNEVQAMKIPAGKVKLIAQDPQVANLYFTSLSDNLFDRKTHSGLKMLNKATRQLRTINYTPGGEVKDPMGFVTQGLMGNGGQDAATVKYHKTSTVRNSTTDYYVHNFDISPDGQYLAAYINGQTDYDKLAGLLSDLFAKLGNGDSLTAGSELKFIAKLQSLVKEFIPGEIKLWKKATTGWTELPALTYFEGIYHKEPLPIKFSRDSRLLLTVNPANQSELMVWQLDSMKIHTTLSGITGDDLNSIDKTILINEFEISDDNRYVAIAYESNNIEIHDLHNPEGGLVYPAPPEIYTLSKITSLKFTRDNKYLLAGLQNGSMEMYGIESRSTYLKMYFGTKESDYYIPSPRNFYTCGKAAYKKISFALIGKTYPVSQFDFILNRPDFITYYFTHFFHTGRADSLKRMELVNRYAELVKKRVLNYERQPMWAKPELLYMFPPQVDIVNYDYLLKNQFTSGNRILLKLKLSGYDHAITNLQIKVNGSPLHGVRGLPVHTRDTLMEIYVPLDNGKNKIDLFCINEAGREGFRETVVIHCRQQQKIAKKGKLFFVALSINQYEGQLPAMRKSVIDAIALQNKLKEKNNAQKYSAIIVRNFFDKNVTRENIVQLKNELLHTLQPEDNLVVLLQGHGASVSEDGKYYFATVKTWAPGTQLSATTITSDLIEWLVDSLPTRNKLMVINTCASGKIDRDLGNKTPLLFEEMEATFEDLSDNTGTIVISATSANLAIQEGPLSEKNTPLIATLLKAISNNNADIDHDGQIRISELLNYIQNEVQYEKGNLKPKPAFRHNNIDNDFVLISAH
ncbi:caspase family protein [Paraflavitalea devenefica]|uniref:caspase family protein n=1 Tax=Paraflavitalea devenefica TaxID=2716334 RepID=UPI00142436D6|nr:caspase family protein [Paraflavitalea devenefica]